MKPRERAKGIISTHWCCAIHDTPQSRDGLSDFRLPVFQATQRVLQEVGVGEGHRRSDDKQTTASVQVQRAFASP
jgi:hypothetical protein